MSAIPTNVAAVFNGFDPAHQKTLLALRALILKTAQSNDAIGPIEETLRWNEPAYLTSQSKSGSTIRLGVERGSNKAAIFFNCKTTLVEEFRSQFADTLSYSKNRAVLVDDLKTSHAKALEHCIAAALTYHLRVK